MTLGPGTWLSHPGSSGALGAPAEALVQVGLGTLSLSDTWQASVRVGAWLGTGSLNPTNPGPQVHGGELGPATPVGTWQPWPWLGSPGARVGTLAARLTTTPTELVLELRFRWLLQTDRQGYGLPFVEPRLRWLRSTPAGADLANVLPSVYTEARRLGLGLWLHNAASSVWHHRVLHSPPQQVRFYGQGLGGGSPERIMAFDWGLQRAGGGVSTLSHVEATTCRVQVRLEAGAVPTELWVYRLRTSPLNDAVAQAQGFEASVDLRARRLPVAPAPPLSGLPAPDWHLQDTGPVPAFGLPTTALTPVAPDVWQASLSLLPDSLDPQAEYRVVLVLAVDTTATATPEGIVHYSWLSDPLVVCPQADLRADTVPAVVSAGVSDYFHVHSPWLRCAAGERLEAHLTLDPTPYDAHRTLPLASALRRIDLEVVVLANGLEHISEQAAWVRTLAGTWLEPPAGTYDPATHRFTYRLTTAREPGRQVLFSRLPGGNLALPPQLTDDWRGRTVELRLRYRLDQPEGTTDTLTYTFRLEVQPDDPTLTLTLTQGGLPLRVWCANDPAAVRACITAPDTPDGTPWLVTWQATPPGHPHRDRPPAARHRPASTGHCPCVGRGPCLYRRHRLPDRRTRR
jgi:hypothetical protein